MAMTGVICGVLEQEGIKAEWLHDIHVGRDRPINLELG
jgi:hypothetical protein